MHFQSIPDHELAVILKQSTTIAIVGLSDKPERSSYGVAEYLLQYFKIIPVNPQISTWNGIKSYPSIAAIPDSITIDIVNIFRRSELVPPVVAEVIDRRQAGPIKLIWMQQEVEHQEAASKAINSGISVVMDSCLAVVHRQLRS